MKSGSGPAGALRASAVSLLASALLACALSGARLTVEDPVSTHTIIAPKPTNAAIAKPRFRVSLDAIRRSRGRRAPLPYKRSAQKSRLRQTPGGLLLDPACAGAGA